MEGDLPVGDVEATPAEGGEQPNAEAPPTEPEGSTDSSNNGPGSSEPPGSETLPPTTAPSDSMNPTDTPAPEGNAEDMASEQAGTTTEVHADPPPASTENVTDAGELESKEEIAVTSPTVEEGGGKEDNLDDSLLADEPGGIRAVLIGSQPTDPATLSVPQQSTDPQSDVGAETDAMAGESATPALSSAGGQTPASPMLRDPAPPADDADPSTTQPVVLVPVVLAPYRKVVRISPEGQSKCPSKRG